MITQLRQIFRFILYSGTQPNLSLLAITSAEALVIFLAGLAVFKRLSPTLAEEI